MIYTGKRVFKNGKKEYRSRVSFYVHDVDQWEEYVYPDYKKYPGPKTYITCNDKVFILCISFETFDKLMKREGIKIGLNNK